MFSRLSSRTSSHRAFTLIELLIVIAVIALLAAILFPAFARAREKARQASCASNLKQIGLALKQYAQDYDGKYPDKDAMGSSGLRAPGDPQSLPFLLNPYIKNDQVFVCPSGRKELKEIGNTYQMSLSTAVLRNPDAFEAENGDNALLLILWDAYALDTVTAVGATGNPPALSKPFRHCPHFRNFNKLFLDGHVKFHPISSANGACP